MKKGENINIIIKKFLVIVIILIFIILCLECTLSLSLNYKGQWYSKGFGSFNLWKEFVNGVASAFMELEIVNIDGEIKLVINDESGNRYLSKSFIDFDNETGKLSFSLNFSLPFGEIKPINYEVLLNKDSNILKFIKPEDYYNKTLKELLNDLKNKGVIISFVGKRSNITISPGKNNDEIDIIYERNIDEKFTNLIINESKENYTQNLVLQQNNLSNITNNDASNNLENNGSLIKDENQTNNLINKSKDEAIIITNPVPLEKRVYLNLGESKTFSIEDLGYDGIKWYLDGKSIRSGVETYSFKGEKIGEYNLKIELKKGSKNISRIWVVNVIEPEKTKKGLLGYVILGLALIFIGFIVFYFLKVRKKG